MQNGKASVHILQPLPDPVGSSSSLGTLLLTLKFNQCLGCCFCTSLHLSLGPQFFPPVPHPHLFLPLLSPLEYLSIASICSCLQAQASRTRHFTKNIYYRKGNSDTHVLLEVSVVTSVTDSQTTVNTHKIIYLND